jgi:Aromatic-ring-opening dioxygenase LigAB, LigA subunit
VSDEHELHYSFPPARAYPLNKLLYGIKSETPLRTRYLADPDGVMQELGLDAEDRAAMRSGARDALVARGAHPYLVFMAELRLKADRGQTSYEFF